MAHDAMRTWILVALRAATEPVKEEAMQAIFFEVVLCVVCVKRVLEVAMMRAREQLLQRNLDSQNPEQRATASELG